MIDRTLPIPREALARGAVVRQTGVVQPRVRHGGESGRLTRLFDTTGRLRVEIAYSGGARELRLLDGGRGWRDGDEVAGPARAAMAVQVARLILPTLLGQHAAEVIDGGSVAVAGGTVRLLVLPMGDLFLEAAIDPATGHIVRTTGRIPTGPVTLTFTTELSDLRRVGPLLFPFHEENFAQGSHTATTVVERVELLDRIDPGRFRPAAPAGRQGL
ncbi:MAG: hypothetical protein COS73_02510 [Nitrospirae bacterium CG06_land_8_20_14_3_00_70_43]|nr:MAG: hypothetical protein COS73_02510 [Nitrospirae bacterium CG06_land_8_20_14_3_00_70_43]